MAHLSDAMKVKVRTAWPDLVHAIATLGNVGEACERAGFSRSLLYLYMASDPDARRQWEIAREQSADECAEKVLEIANNPDDDATRARVRMDAYRWLAAKRNPRAYSDRMDHNVTVKTIDLTRIIEAANARLAAAQQGRVIDARPIVPELENLL